MCGVIFGGMSRTDSEAVGVFFHVSADESPTFYNQCTHSTLLAAQRERPSNITPPLHPSECSPRRGRYMTARPIEHSGILRYA